jgi:hypothetical protein
MEGWRLGRGTVVWGYGDVPGEDGHIWSKCRRDCVRW